MAIQQTAQQPFVWGRGGRRLTPEEVERERQIAEALMQGGVDTSPVGHWLQGAARVAQALSGKIREGRANSAAEANAAASSENMSRLYSALGGGGGSVSPVGQQASTTSAMPAAGPVQDVSVPATADAQYIREGLINRGLPEHIADGFLVNFKDESGLNPGINEQNPIVPGSRGGFGLYQLTGPRRVAYEKFAQERGVTPDNVDAQLDFLMTELQGPEKRAAEYIMRAGDTGTAAQAIVNHFLRPAQEHRDRRMAAYANLGSSAPSEAPPVEVEQASPQVMTDADPMPAAAQPQAQFNPIIFKTLSSDYATPEEKALANLLLQRQMTEQEAAHELALKQQQEAQELARRQDLARQLGMDERYAQDPQLWEGATGQLFSDAPTAVVNGVVVNTRTGESIYGSPEQPVSVQEYEYGLRNPGYFEQQQRLRSAGAPSNIGSIPPGMQLVREGDSIRLEPIPGGPADTSRTDANAQANTERAGNIVLEDVDRAVAAIESNPTLTTGLIGQWSRGIAGTPANKVDNLLNTIRANSAFDRLQQMREASPTGGALGAVSDTELKLLQNAIGSLEQSNDSEDLTYNLRRVQRIYEDIIYGPEAAKEMREQRKLQQQENPLPPQTNGRKTSTGATWEILD